jgi:tetratricopeptide (TPR) repeat protein
MGNALEARNWYERYLDTNPSDGLLHASGLRGLAAALDAMGESQQAAETFLRASRIESNPLRVDDLVSAGLAWIDAGRPPEAEEAFREVLTSDPTHPRAREAREGLQIALAQGD